MALSMQDVAAAWAAGDSTKRTNWLYADGPRIFSYGSHYCAAMLSDLIAPSGKRVCFVNAEEYEICDKRGRDIPSPSTRRHVKAATHAASQAGFHCVDSLNPESANPALDCYGFVALAIDALKADNGQPRISNEHAIWRAKYWLRRAKESADLCGADRAAWRSKVAAAWLPVILADRKRRLRIIKRVIPYAAAHAMGVMDSEIVRAIAPRFNGVVAILANGERTYWTAYGHPRETESMSWL